MQRVPLGMDETEIAPQPGAHAPGSVEQIRAELFNGLVPLPKLAEAMERTERVIYMLCLEGMPYVVIGGRRYFEPARVREFFANRSRKAEPSPRKPGRPRKRAA
jgi:hypothetical protein